MSSTPDDGEVEQHAVTEEPYSPDLPDETAPDEHEDGNAEGVEMSFDEDVDTIPQLDPHGDAATAPGEPLTHDPQTTPPVLSPTRAPNADPQAASADDSASIPDDTPSIQDSGLSSPKSDPHLSTPSLSRTGSAASRRPFDRRFQSRLSNSYLQSPRATSPAFVNAHSRHTSLASLGPPSESAAEETQTPWEIIRWNKLRKLTGQAFSEVGRRNFGNPTCLAVTDQIVVGTSKGLLLVFDHLQNNRATIGLGTKAAEAGPITALAISADHTAIAAGHATGNIFTWELSRPARPFLHISAIDASLPEARKADGHVQGSAVLHVGFLGYRRTALVSADDKGMAFSHLATRGTGALGRSVKTTRILGRYPELVMRKTAKPVKKSSVLAFSPLPLGNVEQPTDSLGLVAMLTPYLLVIVSTTPIAQTQHKTARPKEVAAHSAMTAALAWFPAIKLKGSDSSISKNKLVYAWSNVINVLEMEELPKESNGLEDKPPELQFLTRSHYQAEEAIVAVQWLSRSVIAALTITQQLLIIEDITMNVTDTFDLLPKNLYHADLYSHQLQAVVEHHDEEDASMHGVVADAYYMSFRGYKGRLFLLGSNDVWWGSLTNWADRLLALMESGDFIGAIRLATSYFSGSGEKVTIGLPEDDSLRSAIVRDKLLEMISASLRYAFGQNAQASGAPLEHTQLVDLAVACVSACLKMDEQDYLFDEVFEWYDDNGVGDIFVDVLEPHIIDRQVSRLPPSAVKTLINHFAETHSPSSLEEIICLLDATAMDVDQVTLLCKQHQLYDAYIYVWNTALFDYATPLLELLQMTTQKPFTNGDTTSSSQGSHISQKMFPYMSFVLTGRVYPIGEFMDDSRASTAKTQVYEALFYGKSTEKTPFAVLKSILAFDAPNFLAAMNEAFEDSFLNGGQDNDLDSSPVSGVGPRPSLLNRQIIIRILLDVMSSDFDATEHIWLDMFIARNLPKYPQYMLLAGTTLEQVFTRLCEYQEEDVREDAQLSLEYLMTVYKPANISSFVPLLQRARFWRVLKSVYRQEKDWPELIRTYFADADDQAQIFDVLIELLRSNIALPQEHRSRMVNEVKAHAEELIRIDVTKAAKVVDMTLPEEHIFFIDALSDPRAQYTYLRSLLEPGDAAPKSCHVKTIMTEQYVRLVCRYNPAHVIDYINTIKEGELQLEKVIPALESAGNIDAAVVLIARQGHVQDAMDRLIRHLATIEAALSGVLESAADSPDEVATNEAIEDLLASVDKYARVGVWLCDTQTHTATSKARTASKSPHKHSMKQPLSFEETLWLEFIVAIVAIAQRVGPTPVVSDTSTSMPETDELTTSLRNTIQHVFTSLLNSTAIARGQSQPDSARFPRILRAFLSRAAEISPSLSHLRHVMNSIFSAYTYEDSLLTLANTMLDKDLFVQVDEVTKLRQIGWRPRGQVCGICRRRVWGPGAGPQSWEAWERRERERAKRVEEHRRQSIGGSEVTEPDVGTGKGKAAANRTADDEDEVEQQLGKGLGQADLGPLVVFSCRHLFHRKCLDQSQGMDEESSLIAGDGDSGMKLACPSCV